MPELLPTGGDGGGDDDPDISDVSVVLATRSATPEQQNGQSDSIFSSHDFSPQVDED